jgi:hypothetical protein
MLNQSHHHHHHHGHSLPCPAVTVSAVQHRAVASCRDVDRLCFAVPCAGAVQEDSDCLNKVQERFDVDIKPLPASIDTSTYMNQS